jgi:hypothetical protein
MKNRHKRKQLGAALEKVLKLAAMHAYGTHFTECRQFTSLYTCLAQDFNRTTAALQREQHSRSCRNQWLQL